MDLHSITCPLILTTSPAAILNSHINFFCPLDTALVLTRWFPFNFPSIPSPFVYCTHCSESIMWCHIYHVFTLIYSILIKKDIYDRWNISIKLPCVCMCLLSGDLFIFSLIVSSFFSYFLGSTVNISREIKWRSHIIK